MSITPEALFQTNLRELIRRHQGWGSPPTNTAIAEMLEAEARSIRLVTPAPSKLPTKSSNPRPRSKR